MSTPQIGEILTASWGYDQTNVDFYEVIAVTKAMVTLQQIQQAVADRGTYYTETVLPTKQPFGYYRWNENDERVFEAVPPVRRKFKVYGEHLTVKVTDYKYAHRWNGTAQFQSHTH